MTSSDSKRSEANGASKDATTQGRAPPAATNDAEPKKPSLVKRLWTWIDLDLGTLLMMFKGSIPPIVALAMYQSTPVAQEYTTYGYLIAITSVLGFCVLPRGQFLQMIFMNVLATCLAAAVNLLALYCATKARQNTTPAGVPPIGYNSSASAICAIFLIVQVYLANYARSARPQLMLSSIVYCVYTNVAMTYGVTFPTIATAESFIRKLLLTFLTGFGICFVTAFVIVPASSRMVVFKEMDGYMNGLKKVLRSQTAYMRSLEDVDPVSLREHLEAEAQKHKHHPHHQSANDGPLTTPAAKTLQQSVDQLVALHIKLNSDVTDAKREFALGKLESHDLTEIWKLMRTIFVPVLGLAASFDILQRRATSQDWVHVGGTDEERQRKQKQIERVHYIMKQLHAPFDAMIAEIEGGMDHVLLTLEVMKPRKKSKRDEEAIAGAPPAPGSAGFVEHYKEKVKNYHKTKEVTLRDWCHDNGVELPENFFDDTFSHPENVLKYEDQHIRAADQRSLLFTLYLEYLLWRTSAAVLDLIVYAKQRKQDGALKRTKLIFPGSQTLYKWFKASISKEDLSDGAQLVGEIGGSRSVSLNLGDAFGQRKDPERLPARNALEKIGEGIRLVPAFFRNENSGFGFRAAVATMTIGIICYLQQSQAWFLKNRILWAMVMVAISMNRTSGQSAFGFAVRVLGTIIAMVGSYIIWYIVNGNTAGVLVFLWLYIFLAYYFVLKNFKLLIVVVLSIVTAVLIIGYELQVGKIGVRASETFAQPAYELYKLAPIRLGTVVGGLLVAYIWTVFPYPVSEATEIRKDLGAALYLTANYYSIIHEILQARVKGTDADGHIKGTHAYHLEKARNVVFAKLMTLIQNLEANTAFSKFELRVGGRFPLEEYEALIQTTKRLVRDLALIGFASKTLSASESNGGEQSRWANDFRKLLAGVTTTSHRFTSLLSLLSSSVSNGQPLPPYLEIPKPYNEVKKMEAVDPDILSIRHIAEPEYSAFAVIQVSAQMVSEDVEKLTQHVKTLVGTIDFSFHAVKTSSAESLATTSSTEKDGKLE